MEDPSAKVISVLATQVTNLEKRLEEQSSSTEAALVAHGNGNGKGKGKVTLRIAIWRTEKGAAEVTRDGKKWYRCPHYVKEGIFDGLYMTHKACDHDE